MPRILVAEDRAELRQALQLSLRAGLYDVIGARTGREAMTLAASRPPDAVILGLPDRGGTEVIGDLTAHRVTRAAGAGPSDCVDTLQLTPTEWAILEPLLRRPGQLVDAAQLMASVWGPGFQQQTNYLRFHMVQLRRKLEDNPARPRHLLTERGMGYRYQPPAGTGA
jgi:DNA-binding response OmpR family regulator